MWLFDEERMLAKYVRCYFTVNLLVFLARSPSGFFSNIALILVSNSWFNSLIYHRGWNYENVFRVFSNCLIYLFPSLESAESVQHS